MLNPIDPPLATARENYEKSLTLWREACAELNRLCSMLYAAEANMATPTRELFALDFQISQAREMAEECKSWLFEYKRRYRFARRLAKVRRFVNAVRQSWRAADHNLPFIAPSL